MAFILGPTIGMHCIPGSVGTGIKPRKDYMHIRQTLPTEVHPHLQCGTNKATLNVPVTVGVAFMIMYF